SAETALLTFLKQHYIAARGAQYILKSLHKLHKDGSLNQYILRYQQLQASGHILDPAPPHTTNVFELVSTSAALLPEAIDVICDSLTERNTRRTCLKDVREWRVEPPPAEPEDAATEGEQKHYVRKLLNWKRQNRETFYLVNWGPTREPRHHLHASVVAAFETERRLLVRKKFFEDEAVEDDTLNETEA
ncbi:hypothetical protein L916_15479, partial [Phytophthora nicotianae]